MNPILKLTLTTTVALASHAVLACATCGCALSSDAATGYSTGPGWAMSAEVDYINQDQLRHGTGSISQAQVAALNSAANQEVENDTINRYLTFGLAYAPNTNWNFKLLLPYVDRSHSTFGSAFTPITPDQLSNAKVTGLGDIKLIGSYQGLLPTHNLGVQLGLKLPTGDYGGANATGTGAVGSHPVSFGNWGNSAGQLLDTSLQAGNGSTNLIVGAYYFQAVSQDFDAFVNGQFQTSIAQRLNQAGADYRPGNSANVSLGLRHEANPHFVPQLQLNLTHKTSDQGALADTTDTAGTVAYLSPGLTVSVAANAHVYAFVQLPIYSQLQGYQLFPRWTATVGVTMAF
ncbi:MAG: transporter [Burkholderiaceae bacterium]|nr:transporter [Burkholderiaceae bacterium]